MHRWLIVVASLGMGACEEQEAPVPQEPESRTVQTERDAVECHDGWECSCVKHVTREACVKNKPPCFWHEEKCQPTYE